MTEQTIVVTADATYDQLRAAQDKINASLEARREEARLAALARIVADIAEFKFTAEELNDAVTGKMPRKARKASGEVRKVAPKYRNPADENDTWTGRGVAPNWIKQFPKEEWNLFLIEAPAVVEPQAPAEDASILTAEA